MPFIITISIILIALIVYVTNYYFNRNECKDDNPDFVPQNDLESYLIKSNNDPGYRPKFYEIFMQSTIVIPGKGESIPSGSSVLEKDTKVLIEHFDYNGQQAIPIFSSVKRFQESITDEREYLQIQAIDLFTLVGPQLIVLNPFSQYGKEFTPNEVKQLIDGTIASDVQPNIIKEETQVFLGQPSKYPHELTNALKTLFRERLDVKAAYLAHMYTPSTGEASHTLIGIDAIDTTHFNDIIKQAGLVAKSVLKSSEFVDFIHIDNNSDASDYMIKETKPFYSHE